MRPIERPYLTVRVDISGCAYDVRVNDVSVIASGPGYPICTEIPVNHWASARSTVISVRLMELKGSAPACSVVLQVRDERDGRAANVPITSIFHHGRLTAGPDGGGPRERVSRPEDLPLENLRIGEVRRRLAGPALLLERSVACRLPFPRWTWLDAEPIQDDPATRVEAMNVYRTVWKALAEHRARTILPLFHARTTELAAAMYVSYDRMLRVLTLVEATANRELALYPLEDEALLELCGHGKLLRLTDGDGEPLIGFEYTDGSASEYYDLYLSRMNGRLTIIR